MLGCKKSIPKILESQRENGYSKKKKCVIRVVSKDD